MVSAPKQKPLIRIPGIGSAKQITMYVRGRGESLEFQMLVGKNRVNFDPESEWMDRSWFYLVIRELDRLKVWHYNVAKADLILQFNWSKGPLQAEGAA